MGTWGQHSKPGTVRGAGAIGGPVALAGKPRGQVFLLPAFVPRIGGGGSRGGDTLCLHVKDVIGSIVREAQAIAICRPKITQSGRPGCGWILRRQYGGAVAEELYLPWAIPFGYVVFLFGHVVTIQLWAPIKDH